MAVWNADNKQEEEFDVSGILPDGHEWVVYDAYNPLIGPTQTGIVVQGKIKILLDPSVQPKQPKDQTIPCWYYDRANCLSSGTYTYVVPTESALPATASYGQTAVAADTYYVYYWANNRWNRTALPINTHQRHMSFSRNPKLFVYLLRTKTRESDRVTLVYNGSESDTLEVGRLVNGTLHNNGIVLEKSCSSGKCTAKVVSDGGRVWWRVNNGPIMMAKAL